MWQISVFHALSSGTCCRNGWIDINADLFCEIIFNGANTRHTGKCKSKTKICYFMNKVNQSVKWNKKINSSWMDPYSSTYHIPQRTFLPFISISLPFESPELNDNNFYVNFFNEIFPVFHTQKKFNTKNESENGRVAYMIGIRISIARVLIIIKCSLSGSDDLSGLFLSVLFGKW